MLIPNPYPHHPHTRCRIKDGKEEIIMVVSAGREIDIDSDPVEVVIEPIAGGRSDAAVVGPVKIWSAEFGLLDLEDHMSKVTLKEEKEKMLAEQQAAVVRKAAEARARAAKPKEAKEPKNQKREIKAEVRDDMDLRSL